MRRNVPLCALLCLAALVAACSDSEEAPRVHLDVATDGAGVTPSTNELGWSVEITAFRLAVENIEFTIEGEVHAASALERLFVSEAWAHPGHLAGGEVTGELPGLFVLDFIEGDGATLGAATLLSGAYHGANFTFASAPMEGEDAELAGHTAWIEGQASKDGQTLTFTAALDVAPGAKLVGAPFDLDIDEGTSARIGIRLDTVDPTEADSIFQKLDFGALDEDGNGAVEIRPGDAAHNILRRTLQEHDHYEITILN